MSLGNLARLSYCLCLSLLLQGNAYARTATILTWQDDSVNEEGFIVERTESEECGDSWEVIAYTGMNQNFLMDVYIPGACYRVAAYNELGTSAYSETVRVPRESMDCCARPGL